MLGDKVCYHDVSDTWVDTGKGKKLPNGNFACALQPSKITKVTSDFKPKASFSTRPGAPTVA